MLHSVYFSPSLVYLATILEVWVRSDMRYFPIDRRLASQCSGHNPDNIWSADTGNPPSKTRRKRRVASCADFKPVRNFDAQMLLCH
jgi:hypothetical protein